MNSILEHSIKTTEEQQATDRRLTEKDIEEIKAVSTYIAEQSAFRVETIFEVAKKVAKWLLDSELLEEYVNIGTTNKCRDAVEFQKSVVRCRECKYAEHTVLHQFNFVWRRFKMGGYTHVMKPDDFCSCGERNNG